MDRFIRYVPDSGKANMSVFNFQYVVLNRTEYAEIYVRSLRTAGLHDVIVSCSKQPVTIRLFVVYSRHEQTQCEWWREEML